MPATCSLRPHGPCLHPLPACPAAEQQRIQDQTQTNLVNLRWAGLRGQCSGPCWCADSHADAVRCCEQQAWIFPGPNSALLQAAHLSVLPICPPPGRRTIYLTIMSALDFEEAGHKLLKMVSLGLLAW